MDISRIFQLFLLVALCLIFIYLIYKKNINNGIVGAYSGVMFSMVLYYCVIPVLVNLSKGVNTENGYIRHILCATSSQYWAAIVYIVIFVMFFNLSYNSYNKRTESVKYQFSESKWNYISKVILWISFIVGGTTFLIYIRSFGGIGRMLTYSEYIRSFSGNATQLIPYYASIMFIPARLITVVPIIGVQFINKYNPHRTIYRIVFLISLYLTAVFLLFDAGRTGIILFILMFFVPMIGKFSRNPWKITILLGVCSLPILGVLDSLFMYISGYGWNYSFVSYASYLSGFSYPFSNILNLQKIVEKSGGIRWCQDFVTGFLNCIPGISFEPSYIPTSLFYTTGTQLIAGTPNDIITFGYLELNVVGIILVAVIVGIIVGKIDRMLRKINYSYFNQVITVSVVVNFFSFVVNSDITGLLKAKFQLILICICLLFSCKKTVAEKDI